MVEIGVRAAWRSCTRVPGAQCVMTSGTPMMPTWSAGSWAVAMVYLPQEVPGLDRAQDPSSWMTWAALGMSPTCGIVPTVAGAFTTVATTRMLVSFAQVGSQDLGSHGCGLCSGRKYLYFDFLTEWFLYFFFSCSLFSFSLRVHFSS
jgi:hypothetical protein